METNKLLTLLRSKFGFEAKDVRPGKNQLRILGRLPNNRLGDWLVAMHHVFLRMEQCPWAVDISKSYFVRSGKIVFAWRLIFQSQEPLERFISTDICNAFEGAPRGTRGQVMEVPLIGASALRQGKTARGKGASSIAGKDDFIPTAVAAKLGR